MAFLAAAVSVFSIVNGILDIVSFGKENFKAPDSKGSVVQVAVGLDYKGGLQYAGGDLPDVRNFNAAGDFLGIVADPGSIKSGEMKEFKVPHNAHNSGQQAHYSLLTGNENAICIAYVTITWPDGNKYAWDGSWGKQCGGSWYHSNYAIKGTQQEPPCLWIDKNGDYPQTGFQIHWKDFVTDQPVDQKVAAEKIRQICGDNNSGSVSFQMHTDHDPKSIIFAPLKPLKSRLERYVTPRNAIAPINHKNNKDNATTQQPHSNNPAPNPHINKLIISNSTSHSVSELCKSKNSVGPDFVNIGRGKFCRMSDKTLWPICTAAIRDKCFNLGTKQLIVGGKATRDMPYDDVGDWTRPVKRDNSPYVDVGDWTA